MENVLALRERIKNTISLHESHFREFKSAYEGRPTSKRPRQAKHICADIAEALVAFSNADGGELLVGVEDDGTITGIPHTDEELETIMNATTTHVYDGQVLPIVFKDLIEIEEEMVLFISVSKGSDRVYQLSDGRCVRRKDKETIPAAHDSIIFERHEQKSRQFDREFTESAQITDLDLDLIKTLSDNYIKGLSPEKYLQQVGLAEFSHNGLILKNAAVLLFGQNITRWFPRSQVRVLKIEGNRLKSGPEYNVIYDELVQDNIFNLLHKAWDVLRPFLASKTEFGEDATFTQRYMYPEYACREALVNAIAHRDYTIQNGIDVFIFSDRLEIRSPGAVLSTVGIEEILKLKNVHESRNALISKLLRENSIMRELGEGIQRIFEEMSENDLEKPDITSDKTSFIIILYHKSVYSVKELAWLKMFNEFNLDKQEKKIVALGIDGKSISPKDIYTVLNTKDRNVYDKEVTSLRVKGILTEIRSNFEASKISKKTKKSKQQIPRFKVTVPTIEGDSSQTKIFLSSLTNNLNENDLHKYFSKYGDIDSVVIARERGTNKIRGFGFVTYKDAVNIDKIVKDKLHYIKDTYIEVSRYKETPRRKKGRPWR